MNYEQAIYFGAGAIAYACSASLLEYVCNIVCEWELDRARKIFMSDDLKDGRAFIKAVKDYTSRIWLTSFLPATHRKIFMGHLKQLIKICQLRAALNPGQEFDELFNEVTNKDEKPSA